MTLRASAGRKRDSTPIRAPTRPRFYFCGAGVSPAQSVVVGNLGPRQRRWAATAIRDRDSVGDRGRVEAFHLEVEVPEGTAFVEVSGFAEKLLTRRGRAALIRVASETEVLVSWSNDPEDVGRALAGVIPGGSTLLNDASIHALMEIHSLRGRKALELLTDDADTNLRTAAELLDLGFGVSL